MDGWGEWGKEEGVVHQSFFGFVVVAGDVTCQSVNETNRVSYLWITFPLTGIICSTSPVDVNGRGISQLHWNANATFFGSIELDVNQASRLQEINL
jgi:hypothetical protein